MYLVAFSYTYRENRQPGTQTVLGSFIAKPDPEFGRPFPSYPFCLRVAGEIVRSTNLPLGFPVVLVSISEVPEGWPPDGLYPVYPLPEKEGENEIL